MKLEKFKVSGTVLASVNVLRFPALYSLFEHGCQNFHALCISLLIVSRSFSPGFSHSNPMIQMSR